METETQYIGHSRLPAIIRWGNYGIGFTLVGLTIGGAIIDIFVPGIKGRGIPPWLWPILVVVWTPGLIGLGMCFYSVARYPYLSLATGGGPKFISSRSWIWAFLGSIFLMLSPLVALSAFVGGLDARSAFGMLYAASEFAFAGFLLTFYRREKHPTIATFLELTYLFGFLLFPIFVPVIMIGSLRCRRFLRTLQDDIDDSRACGA